MDPNRLVRGCYSRQIHHSVNLVRGSLGGGEREIGYLLLVNLAVGAVGVTGEGTRRFKPVSQVGDRQEGLVTLWGCG